MKAIVAIRSPFFSKAPSRSSTSPPTARRSCCPRDAQSDEALVKAADDNLYKAKEGGRNRQVASAAEEAAAGATSRFS